MITVDKYGASVKIYDGQVNMFFNAAQMKEGWRVISTGGIYMASFYQWLTAPITDFTINGVPITTIDEFTTQLAAATPNAGGGGGSYLVYTALLTQNNTSAPTVQILENTIGDIVWTRSSQGNYFGTLAGAFPVGKTVCPPFGNPYSFIGIFDLLPFDYGYNCARTSDNTIRVSCSKTSDGSDADLSEALGNDDPIFVEIRVYT